ncbi:hypothetical protein G7Y79_00077g099790 [Physcia stellaris]|nr:hypothetical protein G7Y79_00077g099790 [Physcia stellaris]
MDPDSLHTLMMTDMGPSIITTAAVGLIMLLGFLTFKTVASEHIIPGIPELKGIPVLGAVPLYFSLGAPQLLEKLIAIGSDGISYANLVKSTLVSVHDPALVKEVLSYPEEVASREGDPMITNLSPWWTLRRMIGPNLFNYVGSDTTRQRSAMIREFNSSKSNAEKFNTIFEIATAHIDALTGGFPSREVEDIKHAAENFAISLWGETLYGNPNYHVDGRTLDIGDILLRLTGSPWPSVQYSCQLFLKLLTTGEPTRSEAKVKRRVEEVIEDNLEILEKYEHKNPNAPLKTIRSLSVNTGGARAGPLSRFATEFTKLNLFGGHHSIGSNICWAFIELARHPECLTKLMAEINSVDITDFTTINSKMPYLDAFIMEINRMYPIVHATIRVMNRETTLWANGKPAILKPGMLVFINYRHLHTSPKFWGPDAREFVPERFLGGYNKEQPFMAFGYGPRNCVGYKFPILAAKVYLAMLLKKYQVDVKDPDHQVRIETLLETSKPVAVKLSRRM